MKTNKIPGIASIGAALVAASLAGASLILAGPASAAGAGGHDRPRGFSDGGGEIVQTALAGAPDWTPNGIRLFGGQR